MEAYMRIRKVVLALVVTMALAPLISRAQDSKATMDAAARVMGTPLLGNIQFTATGSNYAVGQAFQPEMPWPAFKVTRYKADIDYMIPAMRVDLERTNPDGPVRGGGGLPLQAPQRQIQSLREMIAWNMADLNGATAALAPPAAVSDRLLQIWASPHGVIKAAQKAGSNAKLTVERGADGKNVSVITFPAAGTLVKATLNADNRVEHVETRADNPVLGDIVTETTYSGYRDARQIGNPEAHPEDLTGVMFPSHIAQKQGGYPVLDLTITSVHPNAYMVFEVPENVVKATAQQPATAASGPVRVDVQKVADGVYYLTGGTHHSVALEFKDYVVLIETPLNDDRALAVIATVKKTIPNKPIKYVVNTHHHFDHSGGLRAAVAEGAAIITQTANKPYYEKVWAMPHTISPDRLAKSPRRPNIEAVVDKRVLTDRTRTLELYKLRDTDHADTVLIAYLPKDKILIEADVFTPGPANAPAGPGNREAANLYDNVQRLKLDVQQIIPIHGRLVTINDLRAAAGKAATN